METPERKLQSHFPGPKNGSQDIFIHCGTEMCPNKQAAFFFDSTKFSGHKIHKIVIESISKRKIQNHRCWQPGNGRPIHMTALRAVARNHCLLTWTKALCRWCMRESRATCSNTRTRLTMHKSQGDWQHERNNELTLR